VEFITHCTLSRGIGPNPSIGAVFEAMCLKRQGGCGAWSIGIASAAGSAIEHKLVQLVAISSFMIRVDIGFSIRKLPTEKS
jgi:hypothetical protein